MANGSILPRESGVSSKPMRGAVKFQSPKEQEVTITLPHAGVISGMGIKRGITLIVGGGYHGKSTLLKALETGVYPHVAGDGREYVITDDTAVKIRAEDGRSIEKDGYFYVYQRSSKWKGHGFILYGRCQWKYVSGGKCNRKHGSRNFSFLTMRTQALRIL